MDNTEYAEYICESLIGRTMESLEYIMSDCGKAIASLPSNPNLRKYITTLDIAEKEYRTRYKNYHNTNSKAYDNNTWEIF